SAEAGQVADRPAPQVLVADHVLVRALVRELGEVMDLRARCLVGVRTPDRFSGQFFSSAQHIGGQQSSTVSSAGTSKAPPAGETVTQPYPDTGEVLGHTSPGCDSNPWLLRPVAWSPFPVQLPSEPVKHPSTLSVPRLSGALRCSLCFDGAAWTAN